MRKILTITALLATTSLAGAADIPARVPVRTPAVAPVAVSYAYNWSGCYIGVNGGYGFGSAVAEFGGVTSTENGFDGGLAGGQVGCNYQAGQFVFGLEVDGQWANLEKSLTGFLGVAGLTYTREANWFVTARGRAGFAANNVLFYATGGYAHIGTKQTLSFGALSVSENDSRGGWTVGGGLEFGFGQWSLKGEYLYIRSFDRDTVFVGPPAVTFTDYVQAHVARVGLNYRFGGGPVVARY